MHCPACLYPLWGIQPGACPECGTPFLPSEHRFRPGAVRFCCPSCGQEYYGTDENGLLQPREFTCAGCARGVTLDEMVLRPVNDAALSRAEVPDNPWTIRARLGRFSAFFRSLWLGAITPRELMRITPPGSETGLRFAWCVLLAIQLGTFSVLLLFMGGFSLIAIRSSPVHSLTPLAVVLLASPVVAFVMTLMLWVAAAVAHGVLRAGGTPRHPLKRTVQAVAYTCGPMLGCGVPCCGVYWVPVGLVWWGILAGFAIAAAQKVSGVRAAAGVVAAGIVMLSLPAYSLVLLVQAGQAANAVIMKSTMTPPPAPGTTVAAAAGMALQQYHNEHGAWPINAATLLARGDLAPAQLADGDPAAMDSPLGLYTLREFGHLSTEAKEATAIMVISEMPEDVIAHRIGLCVFVYHGLPPDPRLWLVIRTPSTRDVSYGIYTAGGEREAAENRVEFDDLLEKQNELRATLGLRPLPDPDTVKGASGVR